MNYTVKQRPDNQFEVQDETGMPMPGGPYPSRASAIMRQRQLLQAGYTAPAGDANIAVLLEASKASAMKVGKRNSAADTARLQLIHDLAVENGAVCGDVGKTEENADEEIDVEVEGEDGGIDTAKSFKIMSGAMDDSGGAWKEDEYAGKKCAKCGRALTKETFGGGNGNGLICKDCMAKKAIGDTSLEQQTGKIATAWRLKYPSDKGDNWVFDTYPDYIVAEYAGRTYQIPYTETGSEIAFSDMPKWTEVERKTEWIAKKAAAKSRGTVPAIKGHYPWNKCISDQTDRYGSEETAKKVCGMIRHKYGMGKKSAGEDDTSDIEYDGDLNDILHEVELSLQLEPAKKEEKKDAGKSAPIKIAVKAMSLAYVNSLHLDHDAQYWRDVVAVKAISAETIHGYLTLWGNPDKVDLEKEFFTGPATKALPPTDFWDNLLKDAGFKPPLTWDHAQDRSFKADVRIGTIQEMGDDDIGRWYTAQLDRSHRFYKAVSGLINKRALGTSSDSANQYVDRVPQKNGSVWLKSWPLFAAALTTTPCEHRMLGTVDLKSIGSQLKDPEALALAARIDVNTAKRQIEILKFYQE